MTSPEWGLSYILFVLLSGSQAAAICDQAGLPRIRTIYTKGVKPKTPAQPQSGPSVSQITAKSPQKATGKYGSLQEHIVTLGSTHSNSLRGRATKNTSGWFYSLRFKIMILNALIIDIE